MTTCSERCGPKWSKALDVMISEWLNVDGEIGEHVGLVLAHGLFSLSTLNIFCSGGKRRWTCWRSSFRDAVVVGHSLDSLTAWTMSCFCFFLSYPQSHLSGLTISGVQYCDCEQTKETFVRWDRDHGVRRVTTYKASQRQDGIKSETFFLLQRSMWRGTRSTVTCRMQKKGFW